MTPDDASLALLTAGFDGASPPEPSAGLKLWRIGRWLRRQGARRPRRLRIIDFRTVIVDQRILSTDEFGGVRDHSTTRRETGTQLASLASWGRRR
jgi:hypothetical protein